MVKKHKKPKSVKEVLYDWQGKEVLLTHKVFSDHIANAAHDESYEYYETLKANFACPESVVVSAERKDTKIVNIKLHNRKHNYLRVVVRYGDIWEKILRGKRNYIVTIYAADTPKKGQKIYETRP